MRAMSLYLLQIRNPHTEHLWQQGTWCPFQINQVCNCHLKENIKQSFEKHLKLNQCSYYTTVTKLMAEL